MRQIAGLCVTLLLCACSTDISRSNDRFGFRIYPDNFGAFHYALVSHVGCTGPATGILRVGDAIVGFDKIPPDAETGMSTSMYDLLSRRLAYAEEPLILTVRRGGMMGSEFTTTLSPGTADMSLECAPKSSVQKIQGRLRAAFA